MNVSRDEELEYFGDTGIASAHAPVPRWLKWNYAFWVIFGLSWFALYWNGSWGYLDRGHWNELQKAANTTFPEIERAESQFGS
ncbi:MAG: hypothetical protein ACK4HV_02635 [Parachlamydiaceae bacterium]